MKEGKKIRRQEDKKVREVFGFTISFILSCFILKYNKIQEGKTIVKAKFSYTYKQKTNK